MQCMALLKSSKYQKFCENLRVNKLKFIISILKREDVHSNITYLYLFWGTASSARGCKKWDPTSCTATCCRRPVTVLSPSYHLPFTFLSPSYHLPINHLLFLLAETFTVNRIKELIWLYSHLLGDRGVILTQMSLQDCANTCASPKKRWEKMDSVSFGGSTNWHRLQLFLKLLPEILLFIRKAFFRA